MKKVEKIKPEKKPLSPYTKRLIKLLASGLLATAALLLAVVTASFIVVQRPGGQYFLAGTCFALAFIYVTQFFFEKRTKTTAVKFFGLMALYIGMLVSAFFIYSSETFSFLFCLFFSVSIVFDSVLSVIINHKKRSIFFNILKHLLGLLLLLVSIGLYEESETLGMVIFVPLLLAVIAFYHAMVMVFSGVRKTTISEIIRKTYSIEILYGLIVLIVATSLVLTLLEEIAFSDALWYCFAIVTTIGFGDITAKTIIGRILSVVLGIYGIVVVALITSIIVNFYNETKSENDNEALKEEMKELEESRKVEDKEEPKE